MREFTVTHVNPFAEEFERTIIETVFADSFELDEDYPGYVFFNVFDKDDDESRTVAAFTNVISIIEMDSNEEVVEEE